MSSLTEEQRRRIEENRKKALERRKVSPHKPPAVPSQATTSQRSQADIEANKRRALEKLRLKKTLNQNSDNVANKIHPERTSPAKSNELVRNYVHHVMKAPDKLQKLNLNPSGTIDRNSNSSKSKNTKDTSKNIPTVTKSKTSDSIAEQGKAANFYGQKAGPRLKALCILLDRYRFKVTCDFCTALIDTFKSMETRSYDAVSKDWNFKLEEYESFMAKTSQLHSTVIVSPLPKAIVNIFKEHMKGRYKDRVIPPADLSNIADQYMVSSLMPFQQEGVNFGISKNGRLLLADDMGLGKSIQAICLSAYYRNDWPVLVVCPSSLRFAWKEHFCRWLSTIQEDEIVVCVTGRDKCDRLINIISYDLLTKKSQELLKLNFNVVIVDESHLLKSGKTARTRAALPILKQSRRVFLLSGTPALSRPNELYTQIQAVDPRLFNNFQDFGVRYCAGKKMQWGWDFSGASNMAELQLLLEESIMIRRLKSDVIKQLPAKRREMVLLDPEAMSKRDGGFKNAEKTLGRNLKGAERHGALLTYFQETSKVKVKAVRDYVLDLLEAGKKFLVFAHHAVMLNALQEAVENKYEYIRIDGRVQAETRKLLCDRFQQRDDVKVALLSITAANTGLNLTAASLVVFAELFWNPGVLTQAEDRVHRIGQEDSVVIHYLVATNTADDYIWPLIQSKLDVLGKAGLSKDNFSDADTVVAKSKNHLQTGILDYFKEHSDDVLTENGVVSGDAVKADVEGGDVIENKVDKRVNDVTELDWGDDDDDDSLVELVEAVELTSQSQSSENSCDQKSNEIKEKKINVGITSEKSSEKSVNRSNVRISQSGLWNLSAQTTEISKSVIQKVSRSDDPVSKVKPEGDTSFDWLDSIDDELSDAMLAGGPDVKRRKIDA